ncbi:MAG: DNA-directed RNA polymerase subunit omega [Deltaproteobacteria bacterium]|nr:DNA-directed RNA polymerase subunit omega [bacterium]MCB9475963.1 DNA-directed RNA polymerase subunit omega [Deltaproteobacteria bacterium]MCB9487100.1 DNA-directed RNA polymerase subunit omega [Deltaproteobacteria bacterium]
MARITVEDCIEKVENRFALVLLASRRTRQLMKGSKFLLNHTDNKDVVNSLREIAAGRVWIESRDPQAEADQAAAALAQE